MSHEYIVQMDGITVQFPGVLALDKVHFDAKPGEVHVLLGENGAGKSTIMKVLAGVNTNYEGRILYKGKEIVARSVDEQRARGVSIIFQEMNLLKNLTVAENMFLGRQPTTRTGSVDWKAMNQQARELLDSINSDISEKALVSTLSVGQMQMVEIAKALSFKCDIIIMDEPTSALTEKEVDALFHIIRNINLVCQTECVQADDLFDATQNLDCFVHTSSTLRICAVNLSKICNDLRLLSSGPKAGLGEINLPPRQNGSSIMPGKINPVIPEVVSQVAFNIIGNDVTVTMAAEAGQMELNAFEPVIFYKIFESIDTLKGAVETLIDNCILGITANREHCRRLVESSAALATALCPALGYKKSADIAKRSMETGIPVRRIVLEEKLMTEAQLDQCLNLKDMTQPGHLVEYHKMGGSAGGEKNRAKEL